MKLLKQWCRHMMYVKGTDYYINVKEKEPKTQKDPKTHRNYTLKIKPKLIRCALEPLRESGLRLYMIRTCMLLHKGMLRARCF